MLCTENGAFDVDALAFGGKKNGLVSDVVGLDSGSHFWKLESLNLGVAEGEIAPLQQELFLHLNFIIEFCQRAFNFELTLLYFLLLHYLIVLVVSNVEPNF